MRAQHVPHSLTGQVPSPNNRWLADSQCWHVTWVNYGYVRHYRFTVPHPLSLNIFVFCGLWSPRLCAGCKRRWSATLLGNAQLSAWFTHVRGRALALSACCSALRRAVAKGVNDGLRRGGSHHCEVRRPMMAHQPRPSRYASSTSQCGRGHALDQGFSWPVCQLYLVVAEPTGWRWAQGVIRCVFSVHPARSATLGAAAFERGARDAFFM